jgi:hypothetical protein
VQYQFSGPVNPLCANTATGAPRSRTSVAVGVTPLVWTDRWLVVIVV